MNHSTIEWSLKKKMTKEILKFEVGKNQSQKNRSQKIQSQKIQSEKSVSVKPCAGTNTQDSSNPCIAWITVLLNDHWRRKSIMKFQKLKSGKINVRKIKVWKV